MLKTLGRIFYSINWDSNYPHFLFLIDRLSIEFKFEKNLSKGLQVGGLKYEILSSKLKKNIISLYRCNLLFKSLNLYKIKSDLKNKDHMINNVDYKPAKYCYIFKKSMRSN